MARAVKFDLLSQQHRRDPFPGLARLREAGPVVPVRFPVIGTLHVVTTHAAVEALLKNPADFSVDIAANGRSRLAFLLKWMPRTLRILANNMLQKDDPEHRRLRKLVDAAFRRTAVEEWRPRVERLAARHLDRLEASASRDLVEHVARPLPLSVICEILGLPEADQPQFLRWMADVAKPDSLIGALRIFPALRRINAYMRERIAERRAAPRDDLISVLVAAEIDGDRLSDDDLLAMCFLLFAAGHETTTHLISGGVLALLQNPEELARLRHDPALMPGAVDELLRHVSPVEFSKPRFPRRETDLAGVPVRPGMQLMASIAAANSDPAVFERPERLDLSRGGNRHLGLGTGPHFCLGAWLAKLEVEVLLRQLLERAPDLRLGVPEDELRWSERPGFRALQALPLAYTPARQRRHRIGGTGARNRATG